MEIYRNEPTNVKFKAPVANATYSVTIRSKRPGDTEHTQLLPSVTPETDAIMGSVLNLPVAFEHTWYDGKIVFDISINTGTSQHTYQEFVDVVTPLFRWEDLGSAYPKPDTPELERLVRHVVESRTGQHFGMTIRKHQLFTSSNVANFDVPLVQFTGISDRYATGSTTLNPPKMSYEYVNDNFGLKINWSSYLYDQKTDSMWILQKRNPVGCVTMEGVFGYQYVPEDVKQAALLIAGTWGCEQAVWRDRYIQTMRSSDWSVAYHEGAYSSTGSVTADQLLAKYSRRYVPEVF